jgi:hypothetical protein
VPREPSQWHFFDLDFKEIEPLRAAGLPCQAARQSRLRKVFSPDLDFEEIEPLQKRVQLARRQVLL